MLHTCVKKHTIVISTRRTTEPMEGDKYQALTSTLSAKGRRNVCSCYGSFLKSRLTLNFWEISQFLLPFIKVIFICFFKGAPFLELELFWKRKITFKRKKTHFDGMALPDLSAFNVHKTKQNKNRKKQQPWQVFLPALFLLAFKWVECWRSSSYITKFNVGLPGGQSSGCLHPESS